MVTLLITGNIYQVENEKKKSNLFVTFYFHKP